MLIRPAAPADAAALAELINAINSLEGATPPVPMTEALVRRDLLGDAPRAILRVAEQGGQLVGFATAAFVYDAARAADSMLLLDLYVQPASRRQGAARRLMAALAALALRHGAACLWWGVDAGDEEATLFYRSIGAVSEGRFSGEILEAPALATLAHP
jgi:GNAT superfamily N-acetyltransferase